MGKTQAACCFIVLSLFAAAPILGAEEPAADMVKRNVLVLPFVNSTRDARHDYLKDTIGDAIRANLLKTGAFNLSRPAQAGEPVTDPAAAVRLAMNAQSDVVVIGRFTVIENTIAVHIQAIDVFSGEIVIVVNRTGALGVTLLALIDNLSTDLARKMAASFPEIDRSYFTEMKRIMNEKERARVESVRTTGTALCLTGGGAILAGLTVLIIDFTVQAGVLLDSKSRYESTGLGFDEYTNAYNLFIGLFVGSAVLTAAGIILEIVGIPMLLEKESTPAARLEMRFVPAPVFSLALKF